MKAREYLQQLRKMDLMIINKKTQILFLWDMARSITSTLKEVNVQGSGSADPMADTVAKIVDLQAEIKSDIDSYVEAKLEAIRLINMVDNDEYISILFRRYINYDSWRMIASDMHYTRQSVIKKHDLAIDAFQKVLDDQEGQRVYTN